MELSSELIIKLSLAILIGGIIGFERELRSKSAGFRTIILICLGATLFTIFSKFIGFPNSPDRIASNVVVGIGFLGAGVIFRSNNRVNGITTAASIWLSAALGVGIGCGYYEASIVGCVLVVAVLFLFSFFDRALDKVNQMREYKITYPYEENQQHKYEDCIKQFGLTIHSRSQSKTGNIITGAWLVRGSEAKHHDFIDHILRDVSVTGFDF
ncbi:MAG: MgtC/SapB transporter [Flavipsychrobacter sp.]|nr:MgtC/SapB transporter [Flavipsychrobacter sp.]